MTLRTGRAWLIRETIRAAGQAISLFSKSQGQRLDHETDRSCMARLKFSGVTSPRLHMPSWRVHRHLYNSAWFMLWREYTYVSFTWLSLSCWFFLDWMGSEGFHLNMRNKNGSGFTYDMRVPLHHLPFDLWRIEVRIVDCVGIAIFRSNIPVSCKIMESQITKKRHHHFFYCGDIANIMMQVKVSRCPIKVFMYRSESMCKSIAVVSVMDSSAICWANALLRWQLFKVIHATDVSSVTL